MMDEGAESTERDPNEPSQPLANAADRARDALDGVHTDLLYREGERSWEFVRSQILDETINARRPVDEAEIETLALAKLFELEEKYRFDDLEALLLAERAADAPSEQESESKASRSLLRMLRESIRESIAQRIDMILVLISPVSYRRQLRADTAMQILDLCSSDDPEDEFRQRRLSAMVWEQAAQLPMMERAVITQFKRCGSVGESGEPSEHPLGTYLLAAAAHQLGNALGDHFDVLTRQRAHVGMSESAESSRVDSALRVRKRREDS